MIMRKSKKMLALVCALCLTVAAFVTQQALAASGDGDIDQTKSHSDEQSMYKYTFYFNVENSIDMGYADDDEVEAFYFDINYVDQNGYGDAKTYRFDMSYSSKLKRNLNQKFLSYFQTDDDDSYKTSFSIWVPGIITEVKGKLNMSGEKLSVYVEKITLGSMAVNTNRDYLSSVYYDSDATIKCSVPASQIALDKGSLPSKYSADMKDQYGAIVSETLYNKAKADTQRYLYHLG